MLHELLPSSWGHVSDHKSLKLERVSGAMTNCIFFVSGPAESDSAKPPKVLLRIYGAAAGNFIKRDREMFWLCKMGSSGVAPKLLAAFENGRFEQYLDSVTLTKDDIRDPETSRQIAVGLFKLHQLLQNCDGEEEATADPDLFGKMRRWHKLALRAAQECKESHPQRYLELRNVVNVRTLAAEIDELEEKLLKINSPPVFAHNDLQYGNILRKVKDGSIVIVDYEYSSINYRGYDFGNHFCEWAADYHSDASHEMHFDRYPTQAEQDNFLSAYIDAQVEAKEIEKPSEAQRQEILKDMRREANQFSLCSNLLWGLWGIMQSGETNIDFDYLGYGSQRFREYFRVKDQYLNL
ncbi:kinase-like domain-containing protein [Phlyctochytrium arcticum]|nr:kinase-like domain-containing protein [Phlyctochytrium arcticum]